MLIPAALLPEPAAAVLAANSALIIECNRIWSLKQLGAVGPQTIAGLFAAAEAAHDRALDRIAP